jgi:hypothetical protein
MDTATKPEMTELERLSDQLGDRESIRQLSRAILSTFVGSISLGISIKLLIDSARFPYLGIVVAVVAVGAWTVAVISFRRSRTASRREAQMVERLQKEQERLGLLSPGPPGQLPP